jgi:hypothetical protein
MASVIREASIEAPAARCWDAVRDFSALPERLAYTVTDGPLQAAHYNAAVQVIAERPESCRFVWAIDVLPDELGARVGELMDAGLRAIKATLEER